MGIVHSYRCLADDVSGCYISCRVLGSTAAGVDIPKKKTPVQFLYPEFYYYLCFSFVFYCPLICVQEYLNMGVSII